MTTDNDSQDLAAGRYLNFQVGEVKYAIPLLTLREVIAPTEATHAPHMPAHCRGYINLRGEIIPVIDLAVLLKPAKPAKMKEPAVLIVHIAGHLIGLMVDAVCDVTTFREDAIDKTESGTPGLIDGVAKRDDELVLILRIQNLPVKNDILVLKNKAAA